MRNSYDLSVLSCYEEPRRLAAKLKQQRNVKAIISLEKNYDLELLTPRKKRKGDVLVSSDAFSTFVSSIRQPVECFFNWLNRLTNIQSACTVRSLSGLLLHVFGRIAAALAALLLNP